MLVGAPIRRRADRRSVTLVDASRRLRHLPLLRRQQWLWGAVAFPYRGTLRTVSRVRGIDRVIDGETCRWRYPFSELSADFEAPVLRVFRELVKPGSTVFDVGASFGLFSVVAGRRVGDEGRVYAFEPSSVAGSLADHLRLNGVAGRVEIVPQVVAAEPGEAEFWEPQDLMLASVSRPAAERGAGAERETTSRVRPATSIDAFCESRGVVPDVLKIDVEGAEAAVLRGAERFLGRRRGSIVLEVHPWALPHFGGTQEGLLAQLDAFGWTAEELYSRGNADDPARTIHYLCRSAGWSQG